MPWNEFWPASLWMESNWFDPASFSASSSMQCMAPRLYPLLRLALLWGECTCPSGLCVNGGDPNIVIFDCEDLFRLLSASSPPPFPTPVEFTPRLTSQHAPGDNTVVWTVEHADTLWPVFSTLGSPLARLDQFGACYNQPLTAFVQKISKSYADRNHFRHPYCAFVRPWKRLGTLQEWRARPAVSENGVEFQDRSTGGRFR